MSYSCRAISFSFQSFSVRSKSMRARSASAFVRSSVACAVVIALVGRFQARFARARLGLAGSDGGPLRSDIRRGLHRFELRDDLALLDLVAFNDKEFV